MITTSCVPCLPTFSTLTMSFSTLSHCIPCSPRLAVCGLLRPLVLARPDFRDHLLIVPPQELRLLCARPRVLPVGGIHVQPRRDHTLAVPVGLGQRQQIGRAHVLTP